MDSVKSVILSVLLSASFPAAEQPVPQDIPELAKRIAHLEAKVEQMRNETQVLRTQLKVLASVAEQKRDIEEAIRLLHKAQQQVDKALEQAIALSLLRPLGATDSQLKRNLEFAASEAEMWRERVAWSSRMHKKGYISESRLNEDRERLKRAEEQLAGLKKDAEGEKKPK